MDESIVGSELGFFPIQLHKLERLSDKYDVNLYINPVEKLQDFCIFLLKKEEFSI